jgi:hypothetical protein
MTLGKKLAAAVLGMVFAALIAPAFAQNGSSDTQRRSDRSMSMGHMGHGMMGGDMMSGGMMPGCAGMMQSMNNGGDGRPNSRWQKHPPQDSDNGG